MDVCPLQKFPNPVVPKSPFMFAGAFKVLVPKGISGQPLEKSACDLGIFILVVFRADGMENPRQGPSFFSVPSLFSCNPFVLH